MALDEARKGVIAQALLKQLLKERGFEIDDHFRRRIGNIAKQTGLPFVEVLEFSTEVATDILKEVTKLGTEPTADELSGFHGHGGH